MTPEQKAKALGDLVARLNELRQELIESLAKLRDLEMDLVNLLYKNEYVEK